MLRPSPDDIHVRINPKNRLVAMKTKSPACFPTLAATVALLWAAPATSRAQLIVLYTANSNSNSVSKYYTNTVPAIPAYQIGVGVLPEGLALSGNNLYVSARGSGTVSEYNAATGAVISASFIGGLSEPAGLAVSGNNL